MAKAQTRAKRKYNEANYFRVALTIPIVQAKPLKQYAAQHGVTVNKLLNDYISSILDDTNTSTSDDTNTSTSDDTNTSILYDTNTSILYDTNTSILDDTSVSTTKRKRMPSPTVEMIAQWRAMHEQGKSHKEIAIAFGYTSEAVRKRLQS